MLYGKNAKENANAGLALGTELLADLATGQRQWPGAVPHHRFSDPQATLAAFSHA